MKILLIIDQFDSANNGTTISAKRFAETLQRHGNDVRVVSTGESGNNKYVVNEFRVPFFDGLIKSQGMTFARPCRTTLEQAISWADVVHFLMPFALSIEGEKIAAGLGVAHTAAFHVQPENITSSIGMGNFRAANNAIYKGFRSIFYNKFTHIHCPSRFIANQLKKNGYTAKLHVISNGIDPSFRYRKLEKSAEFQGKLLILMVGRYSVEKRQDILIDAVAQSKYAESIQLVLAGQGPKKEDLEKRGQKLRHPPILQFFTKSQLQDMIAMCDLYVHPADVEIEAISCMEAFAGGLVPVIANSPKSATPQFALDERSLFDAGSPTDLAKKIDYWLDHEEERKKMELAYSEYGKQFNIDNCVYQIEEMFRQAMAENEARGEPSSSTAG